MLSRTAFVHLKETVQCLKAIEHISTLFPEDRTVIDALGNACFRRELYSSAYEFFHQSLRLNTAIKRIRNPNDLVYSVCCDICLKRKNKLIKGYC